MLRQNHQKRFFESEATLQWAEHYQNLSAGRKPKERKKPTQQHEK